ncbi:alpha/beta fold hydrolase [Arthrobacter sp. CJ23]|uniref:alpha/beta fold hydrolase n=1 Tax=Arthrobacter sp. CJ23 TaxID=2972479 RepID=UPI00215BFE70|nr:alpha/beta hydrolase [Arthrobacter sp. CJ23]UVJ39751.1 alpha/beta hydrolase [Arthrobacter sp. CJ23]
MEERTLDTDDGGRLALYSYGTADAPAGRRVLVIGGAFLTALIYRPFSMALAARLGEGWAVDVYDRRGRGGSSEQPADYSMDTEISDVRAVLGITGGRHVFGHSLGGSVALNAAKEFTGTAFEMDRLAVYDAAVNIDGSVDMSWLAGFAESVDGGDFPRAMARLKRGMSPGTALARIPEPVLAGLLAVVSRTRANKLLRELMPSGVGELKAAMEERRHAADFASLPEGTCFLVGAKSPEYYKVTAERLHAAVPGSSLRVSPKGVHGSVPAAFKELVADIAGYFSETSNAA